MDEHRNDAEPALLPVRRANWDAERSRRSLGNVRANVASRARLERRVVASLSVAACGLALVALWPDQAKVAPRAVTAVAVGTQAAPSEPRTLHFADGSSVQLMDARAKVEVAQVAKERVEVALLDGKGEFLVPSQPQRRFVVRVASMAIEVLGATFTVTREAERVHVRVLHGPVQVSWGAERRTLVADEAAWFPLTPGLSEGTDSPSPADGSSTASSEPRPETAHARFLEHARRRQYARAMEVIRRKPSVVRDNGEELMLAADAARLSGDAAAAVPYLRRVSEQHPRDSRAPLAAFTLGRILLFELNRPSEARAAFALTRRLSAQGALAEDALAREVEAAAREGAHDEARALSAEYLTRYPQGSRRTQVLRFAGQR